MAIGNAVRTKLSLTLSSSFTERSSLTCSLLFWRILRSSVGFLRQILILIFIDPGLIIAYSLLPLIHLLLFCWVEFSYSTLLDEDTYMCKIRSVFTDVHIDLDLVGYIDVDIAVWQFLPCNCLGLKKTDFILLSQLFCRGSTSTTGRLFTGFFRLCWTWSRSLRWTASRT